MYLSNLNAKETLDEGFFIPFLESWEAEFADFKELFESAHATVYSLYQPFDSCCGWSGVHIPVNVYHKSMEFDRLAAAIKERRAFQHYIKERPELDEYSSGERRPPTVAVRTVFVGHKPTKRPRDMALGFSMELLNGVLRLETIIDDTIDSTDGSLEPVHESKDKRTYDKLWKKSDLGALFSKPKAVMLKRLKKTGAKGKEAKS